MLHALKRNTVGHHAAKNEPVNPEFDGLKDKLEQVQKSLTTATLELNNAQKAYKNAASEATTFSTALHAMYPTDDEFREVLKTSVSEVADPIPKAMEEVLEPASKVRVIERMVNSYITEIKSVSQEYSKLENARKDYAMYQAKVGKLEKKDSANDKQSRNMSKLEDSKAKYNSLLEGTLHRMKSTHSKAKDMFRAAFVAYWLYQNAIHDILGKSFGPSMAYATLNADSIISSLERKQTPPSPDKSWKYFVETSGVTMIINVRQA